MANKSHFDSVYYDKSKKIPKVNPAIKRLISKLQQEGVVEEVEYVPSWAKSGAYNPNTRRITVFGNDDSPENIRGFQESLLHELIHSLQWGGSTRGGKMYEKYRSLGFLNRRDIVFPLSWERGEVPSPTGMKKKIEDWGEYRNKPIEWADKTESKRLQKTEESISEGDAWSGVLTRREKGKKRYYTDRSAREGEAYYLTDKEILEPVYQQRLKEFGMFLDDYGVPMKDVEEILGVVGWQKPRGETKPQQVRMPQKKQGRMLSK